ncbi:MAG: methionine--tRNA ligase [Lachnospiraceae bacterium]|nr:methionine--tRNA ligase [Lachnospiraceae bacterium]
MEKEKFYITTAIAYASRKPHIGNTYEIILTDAIARYKKMRGYDVYFMTGTDEHGQKIENIAKEEGIAPKEYVDRVAGTIRGIWDCMSCKYDKFIRTTDDYHEKAVQHIFKKLYDQGDIYKSEYEGWYCEPCESFFTETQVVDGKCPDCGRPVQRMHEEAYFFKMSKYADRLMQYIEDHPGFIEPDQRRKEMVNNFLKPGLQDLCVSRTSFKWGVPVTFDDKHVIYVWIDALSNYITGVGYDTEGTSDLYKKEWPADVHIIGKDIARFHVIYWPIILMALGEPLPKKVFCHPWLLSGVDKMSKSRGNVMYADDLASVFTVDGVRNYVLAEMPYQQDGSITPENLVARYNSDLANNLGNLVNRTLAMTGKYFGGIVPDCTEENDVDRDLREFCEGAWEKMKEQMDTFHVADAIDTVFSVFRRANKYIDETAPWVLAKDEANKARLGTVMYRLLESIRFGALMLAPFLPETSENILKQLNTEETEVAYGRLVSGRPIGEAKVLFARLDEKETLEKLEALSAPKKPVVPKPEDTEEEIGIEEFGKVELRCAKVLTAEPVPKAKKLLKLTVDLGYEERQVVSGIAKYYKPEDLIGKKIALVCNLKPAKLCGVDSNGMILASSDADGTIRVLFLDEAAEPGSRIH